MSYYVHEVPGRMRIKIPELKGNPALADEVRCFVTDMPGVESATINIVTGSILINHDSNALPGREILRRLAQEGYLDIIRVLSGKAGTVDAISHTGTAVSKALLGMVLEHALAGSKFAVLAAFI